MVESGSLGLLENSKSGMPMDTRNLQMPSPDRNIDEDAMIAQRLGSTSWETQQQRGVRSFVFWGLYPQRWSN